MSDQTVQPDTLEGQAEEVGSELVPTPPPTTLFRTNDPSEVVQRASDVANALKGVLVKQKLTISIQGREHVRVEGWTTCGAMLGVVPVVEWTRPVERGWEARVVARTLDGRTIGAAEAQCTRDESTWAKRDDYALRSMAQTRATSKALRGPLGFIVTLAGFETTPAEEMPRDGAENAQGAASDVPWEGDPGPVPQGDQPKMASDKQLAYLRRLATEYEGDAGGVMDELFGHHDLSKLTSQQASTLIGRLKG